MMNIQHLKGYVNNNQYRISVRDSKTYLDLCSIGNVYNVNHNPNLVEPYSIEKVVINETLFNPDGLSTILREG